LTASKQPSGANAALARETWRRLLLWGAPANAGGVLVVALFVVLLQPTSDDLDLNGVALVLYLAVAFPVGIAWRRRQYAAVERWLATDRPATEAERRLILRQPMEGVVTSAPFWLLAAVLFAALNVGESATGGLAIGATAILGGATTCSLLYLFHERVFRPITARALEAGPPQHPVAPGVAGRLTMAWTLGTGVPALGVVAVTTVELVGGKLDEDVALGAALFLAALALTVGLAATRFAARSVADPVSAIRGALARVEGGDYEARVDVDDGSEVGLLQAGFNRMAAGLAERERIREAFGTYVDPEIAEHILREGTSLEGEEVEVTVMFLDIRDFTGLAERSSAREVVSTLNRLFEVLVPIIHAHGGHVDKFVGDGLLAVFGAPRRQQDHADQGLAAAIEIVERVEAEFGDQLRIGVGLNSGSVVAGNIGGAGRLNFSVIGDVVNVAARVEAATRQTGDTILVAAPTRRALQRQAVQLEERPEVPLKGKREAVQLYGLS
jgi:adenylate cyclase